MKPILTQTVAPSTYPLDLADAKAHLRVTHTDDDNYIQGLIYAATDYLDYKNGVLGRAIEAQTWKLEVALWDKLQRVHLPVTPVTAITSVQYYDGTNSLQTWSTSEYQLINRDWTAYVCPAPTYSWPSVYNREDAIAVTFTAGYATVPPTLVHAIKFLVAHMYENREATIVGAESQLTDLGFHDLIATLRHEEM